MRRIGWWDRERETTKFRLEEEIGSRSSEGFDRSRGAAVEFGVQIVDHGIHLAMPEKFAVGPDEIRQPLKRTDVSTLQPAHFSAAGDRGE